MSTTDTLTATLSAVATAVSEAATTTASAETAKKNVTDKVIGVCLALGSGVLIGTRQVWFPLFRYLIHPVSDGNSISFVVKKKGLLAATAKSGNVAGEGHAYLKNWLWWVGMIMMILGEICNFVAFGKDKLFAICILLRP